MLNQGWFKATYTELIWDNLEGVSWWVQAYKMLWRADVFFFFLMSSIYYIIYINLLIIYIILLKTYLHKKFCGFADPETAERAAQKVILLVWVSRLSQLSVAPQYLTDQWKQHVSVAVPGVLRNCPRHITRPETKKNASYENMHMRTVTKPRKLVMLHAPAKGTQTYFTARCSYWTCLWH